jgi:MFS family permease
MADNKRISPIVYVLGVVSFLTDVSSEMIFPIIPLFLTSILGASTAILGLIEGIADSTASLVEIFSGYFSDRLGKRKQFVLAGYTISSCVKVAIAFSTTWWQVLFARGLERVGKGVRESPRDALIASSTGAEVRGKAFGIHRAMDTAGAIIGPIIAYLILMQFGSMEPGFRVVFLAALVPAFLAVLVIALFVREPEKAVPPKNRPSFWDALRQMTPQYKTFLKVSLLFSVSYFSFAFFIVRAANMGIGTASVLIMYVFYNIMYAVSSVPVGVLSDRIGRKPVIACAFTLYGLVCLGFALSSQWWQAAALFGLYGVFVAADDSVNKAFISDMTGEEKRGVALGAYNTAIGAAYLPASIIIGALWVAFGPVIGFSFAAAVALVSAFMFLRYVK